MVVVERAHGELEHDEIELVSFDSGCLGCVFCYEYVAIRVAPWKMTTNIVLHRCMAFAIWARGGHLWLCWEPQVLVVRTVPTLITKDSQQTWILNILRYITEPKIIFPTAFWYWWLIIVNMRVFVLDRGWGWLSLLFKVTTTLSPSSLESSNWNTSG